MRKYILILALLLCGGFSLIAQSRPDASIYVTPVAGNGSQSDDNNFFYRQVVQEITNQDFSVAKTQKGANFSLIGKLDRYTLGEGQFAFRLELRDNKTGELCVEGGLLYETPEDSKQQLSFLVASLLYTIPIDTVPEKPEEEMVFDDEWRNKWVYLGLAATWKPRMYVSTETGLLYLGYPWPALSAEFHLFNFLSFETGLEMEGDYFSINNNNLYTNVVIEIPAMLKFVIKPGSSLMLEPYLGAYFNFPLYDLPGSTVPPKYTGLVGFQYGVKVFSGVLFFDARFAMDFPFMSSVVARNGDRVPDYQRYVLRLGLGYKYGLFQREIK